MTLFEKLAAFLAALGDGILSGLFKALFEQLTRRNLDAEAAEENEAQARQVEAEKAQAELEARHEETLAAAAEQAAALRELRKELAVMAERRARQDGFRRAHEEEAEIRPRRRRRDLDDDAAMAPVPT